MPPPGTFRSVPCLGMMTLIRRRSCRGGLVFQPLLSLLLFAQRCAVAFETPNRSASAAWLYSLAFLRGASAEMRMLILAAQERQEAAVLAFADAHVLKNLERILQSGMLLLRDLPPVEPHADFVNVRAGKPFGQIDQQLDFPRRELQVAD